MRLWDFAMLKFLPQAQLKSQWRECVLIAKGLKENGTPNHLLVNRITNYQIEDFKIYCNKVLAEMLNRSYNVTSQSIDSEQAKMDCFPNWHNKEYLRVCYVNLYEKHYFGVGKSRITDEEWQRLFDGYKQITGENYEI